jgi:hypothetical protein
VLLSFSFSLKHYKTTSDIQSELDLRITLSRASLLENSFVSSFLYGMGPKLLPFSHSLALNSRSYCTVLQCINMIILAVSGPILYTVDDHKSVWINGIFGVTFIILIF